MKRLQPKPALDTLVRIIEALHRDPNERAPAVQLGTHDHDWLVSLLSDIAGDVDVRAGFYQTVKGRPGDDGHVAFVALDVAVRRGDFGNVLAARKAVAKDWCLFDYDVKRCEQHARAVVKQLTANGITDGHLRMIELHRTRYLQRKRAVHGYFGAEMYVAFPHP